MPAYLWSTRSGVRVPSLTAPDCLRMHWFSAIVAYDNLDEISAPGQHVESGLDEHLPIAFLSET